MNKKREIMYYRFYLTICLIVCWGILLSQQKETKAFHELDFKLTHQYRNTTLEPTWNIYKRNFGEEPMNAALPRFETLQESGQLQISRNKNGLKIQSSQEKSGQLFKVLPKIQAPCVLAKLEITDYSPNHILKIGFVKDAENAAILSKLKDSFVFELKQENKETVTQTFSAIETNGLPYTLYFFLGNDNFRFMIETNAGLQHIGIVSEKRTCFTEPDNFTGFSPAFGVELAENESATIGAFSSGYFEGIGHADIRSVTYENGEPIRNENGNFYISTSSRFMGKNGGSGGICVYEMDAYGRVVRPVSLIVAKNDEWIEAGTAAKLVFDRNTKQWVYVARAFPSPGGMLHIGKTQENLLNDGLHLVTCKKYDGIVGNSLDGDLLKIEDTWYIAYHGGRPRKLHISKSTDLEIWNEISTTDAGEGISIAKKNGEFFIFDATSSTQMDMRKMFNPAEVVGSITLNPSPGNHRKHGGFPWGCIIPVEEGNSIRYLMVCFSMDEYIENGSGGIFTYGDIFSYSSEEENLFNPCYSR